MSEFFEKYIEKKTAKNRENRRIFVEKNHKFFYQNFDFLPEFRYLTKISIFDENFDL